MRPGLQRSLGLTPQQRQEIVQLRRLFITKMDTIVQQRRHIHQSLLVGSPSPHPSLFTPSLRAHTPPHVPEPPTTRGASPPMTCSPLHMRQ